MADIYIRRGKSSSPKPPGLVWLGLALVILLAGWGIHRLRMRARDRAPELDPTTVDAIAEPETPEAERPAAPEARAPGATPSAPASSAPSPSDPGREREARGRLERARAKLENEDLNAARALAFESLARAQRTETRRAVEDLLGTIHTLLVFNPYPMEEKIEYTIQPGDSLDALARRFGTTVELLRRGNNIRGSLIRVGNRLRVLQAPFRIDVCKTSNELTVYLGDRFFKRYPVGTGRFDRTPTGKSRVTDRISHPTWYRPDGRVFPYGHEENELGTHWLSLDIPGYGIHGTWEPETIGQRASAGCIRLLNEDVEELYTLIPVGTDVVISE